MGHKIRTYWVSCLLLIAVGMTAQTLSDEARVSLLTCAPGEELYARYGHTAIRICDPAKDIDIVFNYGIFDFNTDHFYWKFVRGETWYELGASPYWWFMREYEQTRRPVYEQELNFTADQREAIWQALLENYAPENRQYLYNFVFDNCATRPYHMINRIFCGNDAAGSWSEYQGAEGRTYRQFIRHYTPKNSWADFGINLLFGPKADQAMHGEERLFLPEELMFYLSQARTAEAQLVKHEQIAPFAIQPVPWYQTWYVGLVLYFLIVCLVSLYDRKHQRWSWGLELAVGIPYGLLLLLVAFLTFFSCHPLVGFGWRLLIIPITHLCARSICLVR